MLDDALVGPSVTMDFTIDENETPRGRKIATAKLVYFALITLVVFSIALATLVAVKGNKGRSKTLEDTITKIEEDLKSMNGHHFASPDEDIKADESPISKPASPVMNSPDFRPRTDPPIECSPMADLDKVDCHPENSTDYGQSSCEARGCCWSGGDASWAPLPTVPTCYFPLAFDAGYHEQSRVVGENSIVLNLRRKTESGLRKDLKDILVEVTGLDENKVRIRITDPTKKRFEVPLPPLNLAIKQPQTEKPKYAISVSEDGLIRLQVTRVATNVIIFDTELSKLIFSDQFLQLSNRVPAKHLFGIGEHRDVFRKELDWKRYTLLNRDGSPRLDAPLYGSHPFYLMVEDNDANSHGVLFFNANPMDIILQPKPAVTYRSIGGIFDFFVYLGPSPSDVVSQHLDLIGRPDLPPYWGLGFQLSRYGYMTLNNTRATMERNIAAGIPIEVQWNDIDAFNKYEDFTTDPVAYAGLPEFVDNLHSRGIHYVQIIDPGVSGSEKPGTNPQFDDGLAMDIFVKNSTDQIFYAQVWNPNSTVFPDFTHPLAGRYWAKQLRRYMTTIKLDGAWIDMNEISDKFNGAIDPDTGKYLGCPWEDPLENPPYTPGGPMLMQSFTVCFSNKHYLGPHYDVHNLYPLYEAKATKEALLAITGKRQFIISRATTTGFGQYGMHWTGDILAEWDSMRWTIPSLMEFNMFGMPHVGADICGFAFNTTIELCARWSALGAFYPFSRNHNNNDCTDQDPVAMGDLVMSANKYALNIRYRILPYLYTQFYRVTVDGATVMSPLFFEFPLDSVAQKIEDQFMLGPSLMVVPGLHEHETRFTPYFPRGIWYDDNGLLINSVGVQKDQTIEIDRILIARRGGSVIVQHPFRMTTAEQRKEQFELMAYLDGDQAAKGELFWDDGESPSSLLLGTYSLVNFDLKDGTFTTEARAAGYTVGLSAGSLTVYGLNEIEAKFDIKVNGKAWSQYTFVNEVLTVQNMTLDLSTSNSITFYK